MGATNFKERVRAKSMKEAYSNRIEDLLESYGNDIYNGTMSTTNGFIDLTSEFKSSGKNINEFIDIKLDDARKWSNAYGICIKEPKTNSNKVKSQVNNIPVKGTSKWELRYTVYKNWREEEVVCSKTTKGDALKAAREYTEKTQEKTVVCMEKVLTTGQRKVAEVIYKQSKDEQPGEYLFFGWAAE